MTAPPRPRNLNLPRCTLRPQNRPDSQPHIKQFPPKPPPVLPPLPSSRRAAHLSASMALQSAKGTRLLWRLLLLWLDDTAPSGTREEVFDFRDPRKMLDLVRKVSTTPDRPLLSWRLRCMARPMWEDVDLALLSWRAEERERKGRVDEAQRQWKAERDARGGPR